MFLTRFLACSLFLFPNSVWAGRPFFTDDAALATAGTCQVENWLQFNGQAGYDAWISPACNPTGNFEMTLGLNQLHLAHESRVESALLQGKTLFRPLKTNSWGIGLAFGMTRPNEGDTGNDFIYLPLSVSFDDDHLIVHTNVGWLKDRSTQTNRTSWGVGAEYVLTPSTSVFAEIFGDDVAIPTMQTGLNLVLIPERLNLNLTYGHNQDLGRDNSFYSIGINIYGLQ